MPVERVVCVVVNMSGNEESQRSCRRHRRGLAREGESPNSRHLEPEIHSRRLDVSEVSCDSPLVSLMYLASPLGEIQRLIEYDVEQLTCFSPTGLQEDEERGEAGRRVVVCVNGWGSVSGAVRKGRTERANTVASGTWLGAVGSGDTMLWRVVMATKVMVSSGTPTDRQDSR